MRKWTPPGLSQLVSEYKLLGSARKVGKKHGVSETPIARILREAGKLEKPGGRKRQLPLDEHAFDEITEESAYWIGFLMADSGISDTDHVRSPAVVMGLQLGDIDHLYKLRAFLKSSHKVSSYEGKATFQFRSTPIVETLRRYGVTPRKSYTAQANTEMAHNRHFWRGVVDGDGCLRWDMATRKGGRRRRKELAPKRPVPCLIVEGSIHIARQFLEFVTSFTKTDATACPCPGCFKVSLKGQPALDTIRRMYSDCTAALDRKLILANEMMNWEPAPMSPYTINDMHQFAASKNGKCLSDKYVTMNDKLGWECDKGHKWLATPASVVLSGAWCRECSYKVTFEIAQHIRELHATGRYSQKQLAEMYGISQPSVSSVINQKSHMMPLKNAIK